MKDFLINHWRTFVLSMMGLWFVSMVAIFAGSDNVKAAVMIFWLVVAWAAIFFAVTNIQIKLSNRFNEYLKKRFEK